MKQLPIGVEDFKTIIDKNMYYIDKTLWIKDIINEQAALYTRPRRFGKTLNMSMLYYFFSNKEKKNAYLFNNLAISEDEEAMKHQNQYPVIFLTLKDMKRSSYNLQVQKFASIISRVLENYSDLLSSSSLSEDEINLLKQYKSRTSNEGDLMDALLNLTTCIEKHYQKRAIVLIDEYDVPLQYAYECGFYDEMVEFLRNSFSGALKTNTSLEMGILTGCLRISKESIFTGLNNFKTYSILDIQSSNYFGFTYEEVKKLLDYYGFKQYLQEVKEWYDGYLFGDMEIYNPWSSLMFVDRKLQKETLEPISFWANTSGNNIVVDYIKQSDHSLHDEFELLMQGKTIIKKIKPELTYRDMDNISNIYSFLLMTGYLKIKKQIDMHTYELVIPNKEVYEIYDQSFMDYFNEIKFQYKNEFIELLNNEEVEKAQSLLNDILDKSISYYDNYESFYHGFLLGLFQGLEVTSNKESGDGRFDIEILPRRLDGTVIIIECKHSDTLDDLIDDSKKAAKQINDKRYFSNVKYQKYNKSVGYGISFFKKQCFITKA